MRSNNLARVWAIVLCHNQYALTRECLATLTAQSHPVHILVVDNASSDATAASVASDFPHVEVLPLGQNLGYAGGNNAGMRHALAHGAEVLLLLNNDTRLAPDCIERLLTALDMHPEAAAAGPMVYTWDGWETISSAGGRIDWKHADAVNVGAGETDRNAYPARPVDFLNGCALMLRAKAIAQVGLLDERYYMYWEETDWCARMRKAGWTLWFEPTARLQHNAAIDPAGMSRSALYYMARNRLLFFMRHTPPLQRPRVMLHALHGIALGGWRSRRAGSSSLIEGQALRDFLLRRFGRQAVQHGAGQGGR